MVTYYDELEIEDFVWDAAAGVFHYPCPCGDRFEISKAQLRDGEEIAQCPSCSLIVRVIYDYLDWEDYVSSGDEEEGDEEEGEGADAEEAAWDVGPKEDRGEEATSIPSHGQGKTIADSNGLPNSHSLNRNDLAEALPPDKSSFAANEEKESRSQGSA